eukprot:4269677-Alexandrium_andersonii.AAC.1
MAGVGTSNLPTANPHVHIQEFSKARRPPEEECACGSRNTGGNQPAGAAQRCLNLLRDHQQQAPPARLLLA